VSAVQVIRPGLLSTVQDLGRWGWQSQGVSVSGPMDPRAHRLANLLVGNQADAATLEVTFLGPELAFEDDRTVAVCGADFVVTVGDHLAASGMPFRVPRGGRLRLGARSRGSRAYIAVDGGFAVDLVFGSRATHVATRIGGYHGRAVATGDRLPLGPSTGRRAFPRHLWQLDIPRGHALLRILASNHLDHFRRDALTRLQSAPYAIRTESDRMGYRLEGPALRTTSSGHPLSEPSTVGALQVPPDGQPILLMADRQTTGGYPKLATVIAADIGLAGQLGPGDTMTFAVCSRQEALAALIAQERSLMAIR
jgi:antagonist of KipI